MTTPTLPLSSWTLVPADEAAVDTLVASGYSRVTARILASRGVSDREAAEAFFAPDLDGDWLDPALIPGMSEAAEAVAAAVREGLRIVVFGDFDLDGISSAALLTLGLRELGAEADAVVPHRFREGYGLTSEAIERVMGLSPGLIVTTDCGISGAAEVASLVGRGVRVVVTDHHEPGADVPVGVPVADPKLDPSPDAASVSLAGAGVALKLVQAVGGLLGSPDVWRSLTDLAALGTVADIVPLVGENRALVTHGLARMRTDPRPSLAALAKVAGVDIGTLTSEQIAYVLSPRLNAAGRVADPAVSLRLLMETDEDECRQLAEALDEHNRVRQAAERDLEEAAKAAVTSSFTPGDRVMLLAGEGWHEGVKGIVASRLAKEYTVPTLLFCIEDGVASGSGRSVGDVDLHAALAACADLLDRYGGHAAAVGCALPADRLDALRERLAAWMSELPATAFELPPSVDAEVGLETVGIELATELSLLGPFGFGNRQPLLGVRGAFMNGRQKVGRTAEHLRFVAYDGVASVAAVAFRCSDIEAVAEFDGAVDLAFNLEADEWRGRRRAQMLVRQVVRHETCGQGTVAELVEDLFARADEIISREEYAGIGEADAFHTKLAGVTFEGRQEILARLEAGAPLRAERQPDNEHDPDAIALFDPHGDQVGFFNRRLAAVLAPAMDAGAEYDVEVTDLTGGGEHSLGVNVLVSRRGAEDLASALVADGAARRAALRGLEPAQLDAALVGHMIGDAQLHDAQVRSLAALAEERNTLTVMATGRGKSLIFQLHAARSAISRDVASVLVYPLRALVADQAFHLEEDFARIGVTVRTLTGESSAGARDEAFGQLSDGGIDVVLTTPEFLVHHAARFAAAGRVGFVVIDEAHHVAMSRAGHRPAYSRLHEALEMLGGPVVLAVTATASDETAESVRASLGIAEVVVDPTVRANLRLTDRRGALADAAAKDAYLADVATGGGKMIVYVNSREQSVRIARTLRKRVPELKWGCAFYNGGLTRSARHAVEHAFRGGEISVVVATSAFGEGVNIPDVRHVALYHLPFNDVEFNQMCGRCGRDGAPADVHLLFGEKDGRVNELVLESQAPARDDLAALYLALKDLQADPSESFEITNAELADRVRARRKGSRMTDRGASAGVGVFRELGLVTGEGHGQYRRLRVVADAGKVELGSSVRYVEARDEIEEFDRFRIWVLRAQPAELLARFNRPILPSRL